MKISVEYSGIEQKQLKITSANYVGDLVISILFNDGKNETVDFKPFLSKSLHPSIKKYLDEDLFKGFKIIDGNLNWNDYELIFPINELYKGVIQ